MHSNLKSWALIAVSLTYIVIILGAYTRLTDAGLGCPDWPGCYGKLLAPTVSADPATISVSKAWTEMIHRYVAGSLGLLILVLAFKKFGPITCGLVVLVFFQALLGMWTVTLGLYPIVVMGHLLGGFAILSLTWLLYLSSGPKSHRLEIQNLTQLRLLAASGLAVLILQIALGGWTSANYAALVCADFPSCQGQLWPAMDIGTAFDLSSAGIFASPGTPLENTARVTIQMFHRWGALLTTIILIFLSYQLYRNQNQQLKKFGLFLITALTIQLALGISNVLAHLPLFISLMHSAVAAILLILMITILFRLNVKN